MDHEEEKFHNASDTSIHSGRESIEDEKEITKAAEYPLEDTPIHSGRESVEDEKEITKAAEYPLEDTPIHSGRESVEDEKEITKAAEYPLEDTPIHSERESSEDESEKLEAAKYPFEVLSTEEIVQHMANTIKEVNTIIQMPATKARIFLNHFKWDKDKAIEKYYDGDQEKLLVEARVKISLKKQTTTRDSTNETKECGICLMTLPTDEITVLECGDRFCTPCWREYLQTRIMEEEESQTIACPGYDCEILIDDETVMGLVEDSKVRSKYQHLITNSFVECNRLLRWCQTPDCNSAIKVQYVKPMPVTCKCNHTFCFNCGEAWHDTITCDLLRTWTKVCEQDTKSFRWMAMNTKDCKECGTPIEKNGGCNMMFCTNKKCRNKFCWICLETIKGPHPCNIYGNEGAEVRKCGNAEGPKTEPKTDLQRRKFYVERFSNHKQSLKFENRLYESIKVKMQELQQHNMSWIEVQFLKKAVDILCSCRRTLMYTYVFAYYLKKNNQSTIFEDNRLDLETATEILSGYLERDITGEDLRNIKQKVTDKYQYCESRRKVLSEHVQEGYEKEWWEFID